MAPSRTFFKVFLLLKNIMTLNFRNLCMICTSLSSTDPELSFLLLIAGIGSIFIHVYTQRPPECVSHSVSFKIKIVEIGTNEKPACDFLLIIHSNCMCLSCIVSEIHRFINRNLRSFAIFTHPSLV